MPELKLVIFDCDGVLDDNGVISKDVLARMLTEGGLATTLAQARSAYQGLLLGDVLAAAEARLGHRLPAGWLERYERERADAFRSGLQAVAGAVAAVRAVTVAGVGVCVAAEGKLAK